GGTSGGRDGKRPRYLPRAVPAAGALGPGGWLAVGNHQGDGASGRLQLEGIRRRGRTGLVPTAPRSNQPAVASRGVLAMSDQDQPRADTAAEPLAEWVDAVADRFEATWKAGPPPSLRDFLGGETGSRRVALLAELVRVDLDCRRQAGDPRQVEDYLAEFPELLGPGGTLPAPLARQAQEPGPDADPSKTLMTCGGDHPG